MIAIKTTIEYMPSDCDFCQWFGTRPHPYKGWTDICELMGHCMDDDQPDEWIYSGDGRPEACPLIEVADRKTEPQTEHTPTNVDTMSCQECKHFREEADLYVNQCEYEYKECKYEPKTEPQTERPCENCQEWDCYGCDYKQTEREGE